MEFACDYLVNDLCISGNVVLACSGGPDSMALLSLLIDIRNSVDINIIVAHVNHNVRVESEDEERFLRKYCFDNDIVFEYMKILEYSSGNFENEARYKRYQFFDKVIDKYKSKFLFTAHHGDDLIETVLMRICRGSSFGGYSGFSLISNRAGYSIVRPLIHMSKDEILDYNNIRGIPFVIDSTNFLDVHTRNKFRKHVLPVLKDVNSDVVDKFYKFSSLISKIDEFIDNIAKEKYDLVIFDGVFDISLFLSLDDVIGQRIIQMYLFNFYSDLSCIGDKHVRLIFDMIRSDCSNVCFNLPMNFVGIKEYNNFRIDKNSSFSDYDYLLFDKVLLPNGKCIEKVKNTSNNSNNVIRLCSGDFSLPLHVRSRRSGDRINAKGMNVECKIKDVFINCKIPITERNSWPIVVDSNDVILWIPGLKKSVYDMNDDNCDIILEYY